MEMFGCVGGLDQPRSDRLHKRSTDPLRQEATIPGDLSPTSVGGILCRLM